MKVSLSFVLANLTNLTFTHDLSHYYHTAFAVSIYGVSADYMHYISPQHLKWGKNNFFVAQMHPVGLTH